MEISLWMLYNLLHNIDISFDATCGIIGWMTATVSSSSIRVTHYDHPPLINRWVDKIWRALRDGRVGENLLSGVGPRLNPFPWVIDREKQ